MLSRAARTPGLSTRTALIAIAACALALALQASFARASAFTPGDVVVYRVGSGSNALSSGAYPVYLNEYEPNGTLVESLALPTATSGSNKPLLASGSGSSEGLLTLSANDEFLMLTGYDTTAGTAKVSETTDTAVPRTIARVSGGEEVNTSTALTDAGNQNNPRGVASSDGTHIWWSGAGKSTSGGVHYTTLGSSTSTLMSSGDTNARAVEIFGGQLYTDSDPTKEGIDVATVGSGLPTTGGQTTTNLSFSTAPVEPYAFSMVTLGLGSAPDTMYVADNSAGAVVKYGLLSGKWTKQGSVAVSAVSGVTADDTNGVVTIYATNGGSSGEGGNLYEITDASGLGGTLSGSAALIATAPANEAFRGVAFTPGTTFGSGGTPPPPAPEVTLSESSLPAAMEDPTNPTLGFTVADSEYPAGELKVTASSSDASVAPSSGLSVSGSGAERSLAVTPGATVGHSTITLTVEAPNGAKASTTVNYGLSAYQGNSSDRYYSGAGNGSTAIDVGDGYMIVGDDESNVLRLYHERYSGPPTKTFDFTGKLPYGATEIDIESSARAGNVLYWMGSLSNSKKGKLEPGRDVLFAAEIKGSGASTELTYLGSYTHLREDLIAWDEANGNRLGFKESTESGVPSKETRGFNVEGLEFAPGSTSTAYVAFRAPLESPSEREDSLLVPVTNFSSLIGGKASAQFGAPIEWNLGGLGIREIRRNAAGEYLFIAGTSDDSNSKFGLYTWDGNAADQPVLTETPISAVAEGAWEDIVSVPEPIASGDEVELLEDNGDTVWYEDGQDSKDGLPTGLQKDLGRIFTVELPKPPAPSAPGAPKLISGKTPNDNGRFTLSWTASTGKEVTYALQHEDAQGGWSTVASGLTGAEYQFSAGDPESEGTWRYRVIASDDGGESEPSVVSEEVKVDETAPAAPTARADRAPDYAGDGGWYKDTVTVSFEAGADPSLSDGSAGSGIDPSLTSAPQTFDTDGSHLASGTDADYAGNVSAAETLSVQVDATPPTLEVSCPANTPVGSSARATVTASDGQSGLASDPSGTVAIDTAKAGPQTITRTAIDNVGHETTASCTTEVGFTKEISTAVPKNLVVAGGEAVELTSTATVHGSVTVQRGGALDVEGAALSGALHSEGANALRICGANVCGAVKITLSHGQVVLGEVGGECAPDTFAKSVSATANAAGVKAEGESPSAEDAFGGVLKVSENEGQSELSYARVHSSLQMVYNQGAVTVEADQLLSSAKADDDYGMVTITGNVVSKTLLVAADKAGVTVTGNDIDGSLTVKENAAPVVDSPNTVGGKSRLQ